MKGMTGKVLAIIVTLIIALGLLAIFVIAISGAIPFFTKLVDGLIAGAKSAFCKTLPAPLSSGICNLLLGV